MSKTDKPYLILLSKYTEKILAYTEQMSIEDFGKSDVVYDACILNFIEVSS